MEAVEPHIATCAEEAQAAAAVYETLAKTLVSLPDDKTVADAVHLAALLGAPKLADGPIEADQLERRFYDRFFVTTSPFFVLLAESALRGSALVDGVRRYGPTADQHTDHAAHCYRLAKFNPHGLEGFAPAVETLRADSLAAELAFMAFLARGEAAAETPGDALRCRTWQAAFLDSHLACWTQKAADVLAETDDDFYARTVALAAAWADIDRERLG